MLDYILLPPGFDNLSLWSVCWVIKTESWSNDPPRDHIHPLPKQMREDEILRVICVCRIHVLMFYSAGKEFIGALTGHRSWITGLAANPNPKLSHFFVSRSAHHRYCSKQRVGGADERVCMRVCCSSVDGKVKLWNLKEKEKLVKSFDSHKGQV